MFADKVASRVGDIFTILLNEATTMKNDLKLNTTKSASIVQKVTEYLFATSGFGTHDGNRPSTNITGDQSYSGGGGIDNKSTLATNVSVTVIDVLPNGNLVFEGVRKIAYSKETEYAVLRGVVRTYDITPANTVKSEQIADAQLEFIQEGSLSAAQKKGWLMRFNDFVNPL